MKNIALVGFMGSGKSTVGQALSKKIGYLFIDLDGRIEEKTGRPIPEIFKEDGEDTFRRVEAVVLKDALAAKKAVISCGGGVVLREENRDALKQKAIVVYLKTEPDELFARVGATGSMRPLLNVEDPRAEIKRLVKEREPLYQGVADAIVSTTGRSVNSIIEAIIKELKAKGLKM